MRTWASRILVPVVSVLLVLPLGWCCWLPAAQAEEPAEAAESCCCCPTKPAKTPAPAKPTEDAPQPKCCCEPLPAASFDVQSNDAAKPLPALDGDILAATDVVAVVSAWLDEPDSPVASPRLNILHCVWLC